MERKKHFKEVQPLQPKLLMYAVPFIKKENSIKIGTVS